MNLAIFDLDGTLVDDTKVDWECYARALELEFRLDISNLTWDENTHVTGLGITRWAFQQVFGRYPEAEEIQRLIDRFVDLLKASYMSDSQCFNEIPRAGYLLRLLLDTSDWKIAIATGDWHDPATYKLKCAKISIEGIPLSTTDDTLSREGIVRNCTAKAQTHYGADRFSKIVSIGDGSWDVKVAKALRLPFIGVGDKASLTRSGAVHVVQDYRDPESFIELLNEAKVPNF